MAVLRNGRLIRALPEASLSFPLTALTDLPQISRLKDRPAAQSPRFSTTCRGCSFWGVSLIRRRFRANRLCRVVTRVSRLYTGRQAGPMGSKDLYVSTHSWCPRLSEQLSVPEATSSTFL